MQNKPQNNFATWIFLQVITPQLEVRQHLHHFRSRVKHHRTKQGSTWKAIQWNQFLEGWGTTSAKIPWKQIQSVYILFSPKFQTKQTPELVANRKGDKHRSRCKQTPNRVHTLFIFPSNSYSSFWKAKVKTLVNTATIQWIHSTTKYHEAKVTTTKNKRYMYILFQKYPNWENRANVRPVRPAT